MFNYKRILINFALRILKIEVLDKIQYAPVQGLNTVSFTLMQKSADIVLDGNKDNAGQFKQLFAEQKKPLLLASIDTTTAIIVEEVDNEKTEGYIVGLLTEIRTEVEAGNLLKPTN